MRYLLTVSFTGICDPEDTAYSLDFFFLTSRSDSARKTILINFFFFFSSWLFIPVKN